MEAIMGDDSQQTTTQVKSTSAIATVVFFVLAFTLSIPFLVFGWITGIEIMPGLQVAALSTIGPMLALATFIIIGICSPQTLILKKLHGGVTVKK